MANLNSSNQATHADPGGLSQESLLQVLARRWMIVVGCLLGVCALGAVYLLLTPKTFLAEATLQVERENPGGVGENDRYQSDLELKRFVYQQVEIIKSTPILLLALEGPGVEDMELFEDAGITARLQQLKEEVEVYTDPDSNLIKVGLVSQYPKDAQRLVDHIVAAYRANQNEVRRTSADQALTVFASERDRLKAELNAAQQEVVAKKAESGVVNDNDTSGNLKLRQLADVSQALTQSQVDEVNKRSAFETSAISMSLDPESYKPIAGGAVGTTSDEQTRQELFTLQNRLDELRRELLPSHPTIRRYETRIEQLRLSQVDNTWRQWIASRQKVQNLQTRYESLQVEAMDVNEQVAQLSRLNGDVGRLSGQLESIEKQYNDLMVSKAAGALNIREIEPALVGSEPVWPRKSRIGVAALAGGLLLGVLGALLAEWADPQIRSGTDIRGLLGIPVLATVPKDEGRNPHQLAWASHLEPESPLATACRQVLLAIQVGRPEGGSRTILITSPADGDGKSTVAANLAIGLAKAGKSVLLIDAHARRPTQHRNFDVPADPGLGDVLAATVPLPQAVRRTAVERLDVLAAGMPTADPAGRFNSPLWERLLGELVESYDHIVLDAPAATRDDARVLASECDISLLVLRAGKSNRHAAQQARDDLLAVGVSPFGVIVNGTAASAGQNRPQANKFGKSGERQGQSAASAGSI